MKQKSDLTGRPLDPEATRILRRTPTVGPSQAQMLRLLLRAHKSINCHQAFIEGLVFGFITSVMVLFSGREAIGVIIIGTAVFLSFLFVKEMCGIGSRLW